MAVAIRDIYDYGLPRRAGIFVARDVKRNSLGG